MDPFGKTFLNNVSHNVTGYMKISMESFGKEFLNNSQYYQMHGNIHGCFK